MADNVHKALDIAGFIPGIGSFSEGANSLLYAFQGEKGEAALAALSAIPGIKAVKVLKGGIQYLKIIPESGEAGKALKELYDVEKIADVAKGPSKAGEVAASTNQYGVNASELKFSNTAENHFYDLNPRDTVIKVGDGKITRTFKGESNRPYVNSNGTTTFLDEIMNGGTPKPDKALPNGLRWDVPGEFNGKLGTWELVVNKDTNTVVHFLFSLK